MSKIVLSFDDGRKNNYHAFMDILKPRGLTATLNVTTAYVDGSIINCSAAECEALTKEEVIELYNNGFEIAGHGDDHSNDLDEIKKGIIKLREWLNINEPIGFASPNSTMTISEVINNKQYYDELGLDYVRIALRDIKNPLDKIRRNIPIPKVFAKGFSNAFMDKNDNYILYSIPIIKRTKMENVKALIDLAIKQNKDIIFQLHSINTSDDNWSWSEEQFIELCDYLVNKENIEVVTTKELVSSYRY